MTRTILKIDASARLQGSLSRQLTTEVAERLGGTVITRDLSDPVGFVDEAWISANFTPEGQRSDAQRAALALSDTLVAEIEAADTLVIGAPIYNFGVPATLKAWVDQIARAGRTFRYTDAGPEGLLKGKRAIIVAVSGGTPVGSEIDFATGYLRHVLGFVGIDDVEVIAADQLMARSEAAMTQARRDIAALAA